MSIDPVHKLLAGNFVRVENFLPHIWGKFQSSRTSALYSESKEAALLSHLKHKDHAPLMNITFLTSDSAKKVRQDGGQQRGKRGGTLARLYTVWALISCLCRWSKCKGTPEACFCQGRSVLSISRQRPIWQLQIWTCCRNVIHWTAKRGQEASICPTTTQL